MKTLTFVIKACILVMIVLLGSEYTYSRRVPPTLNHVVIKPRVIRNTPNKKIVPTPRRVRSLDEFLTKLGKYEGLGSYSTVSSRGYLGKYQFHIRTLRAIGISNSSEEFLKSPSLQDSAVVLYLKKNKYTLRHIINTFNNTTINGIPITTSGILASAHLVGPGGVLSFFYPEKYSFSTTDANGSTVAKYMSAFAHYDLRKI